MAPHSSTFAWKIPWTEEPGRLQSMGSLESDTTERLPFHFSLACIGEENGSPLQCSCLKNPRGGGARWAAVYGVTQSRRRLKLLSRSRMLQQGKALFVEFANFYSTKHSYHSWFWATDVISTGSQNCIYFTVNSHNLIPIKGSTLLYKVHLDNLGWRLPC